jgi:hypothetical protein
MPLQQIFLAGRKQGPVSALFINKPRCDRLQAGRESCEGNYSENTREFKRLVCHSEATKDDGQIVHADLHWDRLFPLPFNSN